MRAILLLLMVASACGSKGPNTVEFDIGVNAPAAASALVDGTATVAASGGVYSRGFASVAEASKTAGTVETLAADGSVRARSDYGFGAYCANATPLLRETERFVESSDGNGVLTLALDSIECERSDGTGIIVTP